jgi:DNA-binding IclR family transcriptional regulator
LFINSLEKGFRVLSALGEAPRPMTIAELAAATGLGRSATQRLVYTLDRLRYLRRDPATRRFGLSAKVLTLSYGYLRSDSLTGPATRVLTEIGRISEESVSLTRLDDTEVVVVSRVPSQHVFTLNLLQGMRFPAYCSAPGRAMLATLPPEVVTDVIERSRRERFTPHTIIDRGRLLAEIQSARRDGFSIADQELYLGSLSLAAPILGPDGAAVAAVNLFCPIARWPAERARRELAPLLVERTRELGAFYQSTFGADPDLGFAESELGRSGDTPRV